LAQNSDLVRFKIIKGLAAGSAAIQSFASGGGKFAQGLRIVALTKRAMNGFRGRRGHPFRRRRNAVIAQCLSCFGAHPVCTPDGRQPVLDLYLFLLKSRFQQAGLDLRRHRVYGWATGISGRNDHSNSAGCAYEVSKNAQIPQAEHWNFRIFDLIECVPN